MKKYPGLVACTLLIVGVLIGREVHPPDFLTFCVLVGCFCVTLVSLIKNWDIAWRVAAACCIVTLGIFRYNLLASNMPANHISHFNHVRQESTVYGVLANEPDLRPDRTYLTVRCDSIRLKSGTLETSGLLLVKIDRFDDRFNYADRISVEGVPRPPVERRNFHGFDYKRYLMLKKIASCIHPDHWQRIKVLEHGTGSPMLSKVVIPLRGYILDLFGKQILGSERYLIAGFLIGETRFIPRQIYERFKDTGTLHLLAVSGSNVALVTGTVMLLFRLAGLPRRLLFALSLVVIVIFCQLSFNQPSVIRASLMIGLVLVGRIVYRKGSLVNIVAVAALLILLYDPLMLFDIGFQLSFVAAFSLVYFLKHMLPRHRWRSRWKRWVLDYGLMIVLSSVVVQLMVAPILAYYFGRIPLISFLSNLVVIPISSIAVVLSLLLVILAPIPFLSDVIAVGTQFFLHMSIRAVDFFASLPLVKLSLSPPDLSTIIFYYCTLFALFSVMRSRRNVRYLLAILLAWGSIASWRSVVADWRSGPTVTFLDLGQRSGLHVHIPPDFDLIATNADSGEGFDQVNQIILPYLIGEGVGSADIWEQCAPSDSEISEAVGVEAADLLPPDTGFVRVGSIYRVEMAKSSQGIEIMEVLLDGKLMIWLSRWAHLDLLDTNDVRNLEILALPYPGTDALRFIDKLKLLAPKRLIVFNRPMDENHADLDFLDKEIGEFGIAVFDVSRSGAVQFDIRSAKIEVKTAITVD